MCVCVSVCVGVCRCVCVSAEATEEAMQDENITNPAVDPIGRHCPEKSRGSSPHASSSSKIPWVSHHCGS